MLGSLGRSRDSYAAWSWMEKGVITNSFVQNGDGVQMASLAVQKGRCLWAAEWPLCAIVSPRARNERPLIARWTSCNQLQCATNTPKAISCTLVMWRDRTDGGTLSLGNCLFLIRPKGWLPSMETWSIWIKLLGPSKRSEVELNGQSLVWCNIPAEEPSILLMWARCCDLYQNLFPCVNCWIRLRSCKSWSFKGKSWACSNVCVYGLTQAQWTYTRISKTRDEQPTFCVQYASWVWSFYVKATTIYVTVITNVSESFGAAAFSAYQSWEIICYSWEWGKSYKITEQFFQLWSWKSTFSWR